MSTFKPSRVTCFFPNSEMQKGELEIMAAHVVSFLASNGDDWETTIQWPQLVKHLDEARMPHPLYEQPHKNPFFMGLIAPAMRLLAERGYLEWVLTGQSFRASRKLIDFCAPYLKKEAPPESDAAQVVS